MWIVKEDFSAKRQHCTVGEGVENASFDELLCYCPKRFDQGRFLELLLPLTPTPFQDNFAQFA